MCKIGLKKKQEKFVAGEFEEIDIHNNNDPGVNAINGSIKEDQPLIENEIKNYQ